MHATPFAATHEYSSHVIPLLQGKVPSFLLRRWLFQPIDASFFGFNICELLSRDWGTHLHFNLWVMQVWIIVSRVWWIKWDSFLATGSNPRVTKLSFFLSLPFMYFNPSLILYSVHSQKFPSFSLSGSFFLFNSFLSSSKLNHSASRHYALYKYGILSLLQRIHCIHIYRLLHQKETNSTDFSNTLWVYNSWHPSPIIVTPSSWCNRKEGSTDRPPSLPDEPVWVPFDPRASSDLPNAPAPKDGFDLYIDGVRFLPDNATIVKVCSARDW